MWDYDVGMEQVYRLSLGCGQETGNLLRWFDLRNKADITEGVQQLKDPSCTYRDRELNTDICCFVIEVQKTSILN